MFDTAEFTYHVPVLLNEVLDSFDLDNAPEGCVFLDSTIGGAGHGRKILAKIAKKGGRLIGLDLDDDALCESKKVLSSVGGKFDLVKSNYKDFEDVLNELNINSVDYILVDLGVSMHELTDPDRGFTYRGDAPLDARMDQDNPLTAEIVVNEYPQEKLFKIFKIYGEEKFASSIAKNIVIEREKSRIRTASELVSVIAKSMPAKSRVPGFPKRVFQAIRIEVNAELDGLEQTFYKMISRLKSGGIISVISFHSLEDRIVKNVFSDLATGCTCDKRLPYCVCGRKQVLTLLNKKPITASDEELSVNTASSCAKLRSAQKLPYIEI